MNPHRRPNQTGSYQGARRTNIAISGLTAAGKTTHSQLLAERLGFEYVSATRVMLDLAGLEDRDPAGLWFRSSQSAKALLTDDDITARLTERLTEMASSSSSTIFDTWGLPWFYDGALIRIFIESDRRSRSWKCFVSQGGTGRLSVPECLDLIRDKDQSTRDVFMRVHGFDIFADRARFDAVLDNSHLLSEPSAKAAARGIAAFDEVVVAVVDALTHESLSGLDALDGRCLRYVRGYDDLPSKQYEV